MDQDRWERIQALFHAALERSDAERQAFLVDATAGDPGLLAEVTAMLEEDARTGSLLDRDLGPVAGGLLPDALPAGLLAQAFGPYRIRRVLGEGGMGTVYLAERDDLGGRAALKILRDASLSPSRRERFAAEQRTLAQLHHPAIAQLYDADTLPDGTPWLAMEYVDGETLTGYCRSRRTSLRGRLLLFRAVCEAVLHAHRQAVIHRDLKPSNILVMADGRVKLLDFGIAKQLESLDDGADQTRTGLRLLTPAYAAPEQLRGNRVGVYTDIYSLGVLLYELLTGRLPFDRSGASPPSLAPPLADREPERPSVAALRSPDPGYAARAVGRAAWADLDVLCLTSMHTDPQRRYRTVDALIRDIDHFLDGDPLDARPDALGYRLGKFVRRHRQPAAAAAMGLVVVLALVGFYTVRLAGARNEALAEAARTQRIQRFMLDLFRGGENETGPPDSLRVLTLIDRGLQEAASLEREPAVQAELFQTLGGIYQHLGNLPRADSLLQAALDQRQRRLGPDHVDVGRSQVALGLLRVDQAEYEEAERLIRDGAWRIRGGRRADHPDVASAGLALGRVLEERGRYPEAIDVLTEVARGQAGSGETPELVSALYGLSNNHFYAGNYPVADSLTRVVLEMDRRLHGDRHPSIAQDLINLGAIQHEQGQYKPAEIYYREAIEILRGWYGEDHPRSAAALTMLARTLTFDQRLDEADSLLQQALVIRERVFGPLHPQVASTANELGNVALRRGQPAAAEAHYHRMLRIYRAVYQGSNHYLVGIPLSNLASAAHARRDFVAAEDYMREALAIFQANLPPKNANIAIAYLKLGRALLRQRRFADAVVELEPGYRLLMAQAEPAQVWVDAARTDLAAAYDGLKRPADAARYRSPADSARR